MRSQRTARPPKRQNPGVWSRPLLEDGKDLKEQAISILLSHVSVSESGRPLPDCPVPAFSEKDVRNAVEILKGQPMKDDRILRTLAYLSVSSSSEEIRRMAREAIERHF
jgi:hypothetical protein